MTSRATREREERVLDELCEQLERREGSRVRVISRPDREERRRAAVDALMARGAETWAVEHTRVFDRPNQLGLHKRLDLVRPIIVQEVTGALPLERVGVAVPVEELPVGPAGAKAARLIAQAAITHVPSLPEGKAKLVEVDGFSRGLGVIRHLRVRGKGMCLVLALTPERDDELRVREMRRAMEDKRAKVLRMREQGHKTMLLLDSAEMLWHETLYSAFERAATSELVQPYDEIVLALSGWEPALFLECPHSSGRQL